MGGYRGTFPVVGESQLLLLLSDWAVYIEITEPIPDLTHVHDFLVRFQFLIPPHYSIPTFLFPPSFLLLFLR